MPTETASSARDNCDGDVNNQFACANKPSFRGTCSDVYRLKVFGGMESGKGDYGKVDLDKFDKVTIEDFKMTTSTKGAKMANGLPAPTFYYTSVPTGGPDQHQKWEPIDDGPCPPNAHGACCCGTDACHAKWPGLSLCPGFTPSGSTTKTVVFVRTVTCCGQ